jgi:hypothetical protein
LKRFSERASGARKRARADSTTARFISPPDQLFASESVLWRIDLVRRQSDGLVLWRARRDFLLSHPTNFS